MYRVASLAAAALLVAVTASAQETQKERSEPRARPPSTVQILNQQVLDVRFVDTPLEQVVEWVADLMHLNVSVRWNVLADAGISRDTPISIRARNLRLAQVLWLIMNEAGGSETRLGYRASGNLFVLSTAADLNREMVTKVYDVTDLLIDLPRASRQSNMDVTQNLARSSGANIFTGETRGDGTNAEYPGEKGGETAGVQSLIELIQQTIEPDSWRVNSGDGTITAFRHLLVVRNTIVVHQQLGGYLTEAEIGGQ